MTCPIFYRFAMRLCWSYISLLGRLIADRIAHYERLRNLRTALENTWSHSADLKHCRDLEERAFIRWDKKMVKKKKKKTKNAKNLERFTEKGVWDERSFHEQLCRLFCTLIVTLHSFNLLLFVGFIFKLQFWLLLWKAVYTLFLSQLYNSCWILKSDGSERID